jgi:hypothetical protein
MSKKIVYNEHHPWRERWADFTIPLRKWEHLFIRRLEQYKPTPSNLEGLENVLLAVRFVYQKMANILHKTSNYKLEQLRGEYEIRSKTKKKVKGS